MIGRRLAAVEASGSQAERRERKGSDFCVGNDCGKGPLARTGHPGERDAAPTGLEFFDRGVYVMVYVPRFLSPNPPSLLFSSISICTLRARRLAPCGVSPPGLPPVRDPSAVSHHLRRLSPPLLA
jgi:hypothetical protein